MPPSPVATPQHVHGTRCNLQVGRAQNGATYCATEAQRGPPAACEGRTYRAELNRCTRDPKPREYGPPTRPARGDVEDARGPRDGSSYHGHGRCPWGQAEPGATAQVLPQRGA